MAKAFPKAGKVPRYRSRVLGNSPRVAEPRYNPTRSGDSAGPQLRGAGRGGNPSKAANRAWAGDERFIGMYETAMPRLRDGDPAGVAGSEGSRAGFNRNRMGGGQINTGQRSQRQTSFRGSLDDGSGRGFSQKTGIPTNSHIGYQGRETRSFAAKQHVDTPMDVQNTSASRFGPVYLPRTRRLTGSLDDGSGRGFRDGDGGGEESAKGYRARSYAKSSGTKEDQS